MATGSGTKVDPYIVDTWSEFVSLASVYVEGGSYFKWSGAGRKIIDRIDITTPTNLYIAEVDFNGWTIESIYFNIDCGDKTSYQQIVAFSLSTTIYNLTVNNCYINDPRLVICRGMKYYNCYCYNMTIESVTADYAWWSERQGRFTSPMYGANCYECILVTNSQNYSTRFPTAAIYQNCEVYINYKWTESGATEANQQIFDRDDTEIQNCYIGGKIDLSEGQGAWGLCFAGGRFGVYIDAVIFNIETLVSTECTLRSTGLWSTFGQNRRSAWVTNNGNNKTNYDATIPNNRYIMPITLGDLKNPNYLRNHSIEYMADDGTRYPQYGLDNHEGGWTKRQSPVVNSGIPFLPFWKYPIIAPPPYSNDVYENPYLTVYDMETKQNEFNNNGLAVLSPISGRIVEELNGEYNLNFVQPKDTENKWQYVLEMNIVKALGQLFVIQKVEEVQSGGSFYVSAYAEHITYTLNDKWIFPPFSITGYEGQTLIDSILALATDMGGDWQTQYTFEVLTDLDADESFRDWYDMTDGVTPYEMLLGSNGFISRIGGELYRDNFHMSIHERMENAEDNAFECAIGYNLTGIRRTVDLSTFCTYFRGYDTTDGTFDSWFAVSWDPSTLPRAYPRNVVRSQNFSYEHPEYAEGQLERDTMTFFNQNCAPLVSYELSIVDLKRNPDYKMFTNNYRYKVGDKGRVWDERLQSWIELEITRTEKDIITGDCLKVVIGSQRSFTRPNGYVPIVPRSVIIPNARKTIEGEPPFEFYADGNNLIDWIVYGVEGGVGDKPNVFYGGISDMFYSPQTGEPIPAAQGFVSSNELIPVESGKTYTVKIVSENSSGSTYFVLLYNSQGTYLRPLQSYSGYTSYTFTVPSDAALVRLEWVTGNDIASSFILCEGTTIPENYDTYLIPVTVGSVEVGIPVTAPLGAGESISRSDTGIEIPTNDGTTTLNVETKVKPRMMIQYVEGLIHG